jgi:hypothetical protein
VFSGEVSGVAGFAVPHARRLVHDVTGELGLPADAAAAVARDVLAAAGARTFPSAAAAYAWCRVAARHRAAAPDAWAEAADAAVTPDRLDAAQRALAALPPEQREMLRGRYAPARRRLGDLRVAALAVAAGTAAAAVVVATGTPTRTPSLATPRPAAAPPLGAEPVDAVRPHAPAVPAAPPAAPATVRAATAGAPRATLADRPVPPADGGGGPSRPGCRDVVACGGKLPRGNDLVVTIPDNPAHLGDLTVDQDVVDCASLPEPPVGVECVPAH